MCVCVCVWICLCLCILIIFLTLNFFMQSSYVRTVLLLSSFSGWMVRTERKQAAKNWERWGHNNLSGVNGFHSVIIDLVQSNLSKVFAWLQLPQRSSCGSVTPAPAAQHAALCPLSPRPPLRHHPPHSPSPVWVLIPQVRVFCFKCKSGSPVVH